MQATRRNEFYNVQDTTVNITGINPMIDRCLKPYNSWRPLDGMTPDEYLNLNAWRINGTPDSQM